MDLSYAQNLEDYHLSLAFAGQTTGTYIDIGAGHPIADNVSFWFYERGWRGIVVEPQPELAALYERLRPRDLAVRGLVGRHGGEIDFYAVERLHGLSTTVERLAKKAKAYGVDYQTVRMPVTTLADLCERHDLGSIDFLKIDVEGGEGDVLFGGDWKRFRPKVIVAEAVAPVSSEPAWQEWEPFLLAQGYRFVLFDTVNRFYVAQEHPGDHGAPSVRAGIVARGSSHVRDRPRARKQPASRSCVGAGSRARILGQPALSRYRPHHVDFEPSTPNRKARRVRGAGLHSRHRSISCRARTHRLRL